MTLSSIYMATTKRKVASIGSKISSYYMVPRHEYKLIRLCADLPTELTLRWHHTATAFASHEYHVNRVYILVPPSALLPVLQQS